MRGGKSLVVLFAAMLATMLFAAGGWTALQHNLERSSDLKVLFPLAVNHLNALYGVRTDVPFAGDSSDAVQSVASTPRLPSAMIAAALHNDYERMIELAGDSIEHCRTMPACRLLAGKAALRLGQDTLVAAAWSGDELLWRRLVGNTAMIPQTDTELQWLAHYYGILRDLAPNRAAPYFMLGSIYRSRGGWQRAISYFEQAVAIEPTNARYLCGLGHALVIAGDDVERGLALCTAARQQRPVDMWVEELAARAFAVAGECNTAGEIYAGIVERFSARAEPAGWLAAFQAGRIGECGSNGTD